MNNEKEDLIRYLIFETNPDNISEWATLYLEKLSVKKLRIIKEMEE